MLFSTIPPFILKEFPIIQLRKKILLEFTLNRFTYVKIELLTTILDNKLNCGVPIFPTN